jgi:hypothetical protein
MERRPDWQTRLSRFLARVARTPYDDANHYCAIFAADGVEAVTGVDLVENWRGRHATNQSALRALIRAGFADHIDFAASLLPEIPPMEARAGDIAVVPSPMGPCLGIVQGEVIYTVAQTGLGTVPRALAARAFRVG